MPTPTTEDLPDSLRFLKLLEEHGDPVAAAKFLGYFPSESPEQVAARMMKDPEVRLFLKDSRPSPAEDLLTPEECLRALTKEARNGDSSKDRMAAIQLYMKATGMLDEKIKVENSNSISELDITKLSEEELATLEAIMNKGQR